MTARESSGEQEELQDVAKLEADVIAPTERIQKMQPEIQTLTENIQRTVNTLSAESRAIESVEKTVGTHETDLNASRSRSTT